MSVYPAAGNTPVAKFIPEVWASELMVPLHEELVLASHICTNRDYEGEITGPGDQVHVNSLTRPAVVDYTRNADVNPQLLDTADQIIAIDHGKAFAFALDDLDQRQAAGEIIFRATDESVQALRVAADSYVGAKMVAGALPANKVEFSIGASPGDPFKALVSYSVTLDNANVPAFGRFAVVRPEVKGLLLNHDKFIASSYGSDQPIRNGVIGSIAGFVIAVTPHLPTGVNMIVGSPVATTFGDQLVKIEAIRHPSKFADVVRGLHVAGAKVVRPTALIIASEPA
ncbi:N4-gp56 family major capsid protein [Nonomuraea jabiensis]|uniref:N4-gp56 family major capsid protein n=1 Tax=Nonomuraea jabiensis TaxID=882448 RepID=UPI003D760F4B